MSGKVLINTFCADILFKSHIVDGDFVVFTVPCPAMKSIELQPSFDINKSRAIQTSRYVDVTKVLLQFKERWWEKWLVENGMIAPGDSGSKACSV